MTKKIKSKEAKNPKAAPMGAILTKTAKLAAAKAKLKADALAKGKASRKNLTLAMKQGNEIPKISKADTERAKSYFKKFSKEEKEKMLTQSGSTSIYDLRIGGTLRMLYENTKDKKQKEIYKKMLKNNLGYAEMTSQFAKEAKDKDGRLYLEVDLKGQDKYEQYLGAGHICPPSWTKVAITDSGGNTRIGYRKIPGKDDVYGTKIGYYTKGGDYLVIYSGYKIYPLEIEKDSKKIRPQVKKEKTFYDNNKSQPVISRGRRTIDVDSQSMSETSESKYFTRNLALVDMKNGEKYYHIETKAKVKPDNGIRKMRGRWDEKLALDWATDLENKFGVPKLMILGTSILESGRGHNRLSYELNNYFGIKPWSRLKSRLRRIARSKYTDRKELGDFRNSGKQDHMHYSDAWSSFVRYSELISKKGRYRHSLKYKSRPMMALAVIALSGYCPSKTYVRSVGRVFQHLGRKYGLPVGRVNYPELLAHMKRYNPSGLTETQIKERLRSAARAGMVTGFPG